MTIPVVSQPTRRWVRPTVAACCAIVLALPLMVAIQTICARIGRVTGEGLGANIRWPCPFALAIGFVVLLFVANIINLSADGLNALSAWMRCARDACSAHP